MPSAFGDFKAIGYRNALDGSEHVAIVKGDPSPAERASVGTHAFGMPNGVMPSVPCRCDCRPQLEAAMRQIEAEGEGCGLSPPRRPWHWSDQQTQGLQPQDEASTPSKPTENSVSLLIYCNYGVGAQILSDLGIHRLRLLTNNPRKIAGLGGYGLEVVDRVPLIIHPGDHNADYLACKRDKLRPTCFRRRKPPQKRQLPPRPVEDTSTSAQPW